MSTRRAFLAVAAAVAAVPGAAAPGAHEEDGAALDDAPALDKGWDNALEEVGFEFPRVAPFVIVHEAVLPASPQKVFATLADPAAWPRWLSLVDKVAYRKPYGTGTVRDVATGGLGVLREHF